MSHAPATESESNSLAPLAGWHFLHIFYRVDRTIHSGLSLESRMRGRDEITATLARDCPGAPEQLQLYAVLGHKADFGVVMAGPDPRALHAVQMGIQASALGPTLIPTYSFTSLSEISE